MNSKKDIAVIGMSGIFPEAPTLAAFHENLRNGRDSVRKLSDARMIHSGIDTAAAYRIFGFIDRVDTFDHAFFNISKKEAELMDPVQRILLELSVSAIEHAGYSLTEFRGSKTAVYLGGNPYTHYYTLIREMDPSVFTGNLHAISAGRISYLLDLHGPSMMIDTACSASLVALHEACIKLQLEEVEFALSGGVNINILFAEESDFQDPLGILSPEGKCRSFDASANGTGGGEGGGIVLLKRLDKAIRDKDHIYAVIKGSAANHDGNRSNGLTAPSPLAQTEVIVSAWKNADIHPESITYLEAHGTGTKLGDPVEFQALSDAFHQFTDKKHFCALGALKSNIGHLNNAAGIAGLLKCILSLQHKELYPSLHFSDPHPFIDYDNTALFLNTTLRTWERGETPRRCGISSFGFSGTNVHVVLEEFEHLPDAASSQEPMILKVSAKNTNSLQAYGQQIHTYLQHCDLKALFTLNNGRSDYPYRLAVAGRDREELRQALATQVHETPDPTSGKRVICLLSNGLITDKEVQQLSAKYPVFRETYTAVRTPLLAQQYALFSLLQALGASCDTIIAAGPGKAAKQLVMKTISIAEAEILAARYAADAIDEKKFMAAVQQLHQSASSLFIEIGRNGALGNYLKAASNEVKIISFPDLQLERSITVLYTAGVNINWQEYYAGLSFTKTEAPVYPFQRTRCWATPMSETNVDKWLHRIEWHPDDAAAIADIPTGKRFLVFMREQSRDEELVEMLESHHNSCTRVYFSDMFLKRSDGNFEIDTAAEEDYALLASIAGNIHGIIHLGVDSGIYSLFYITKAFWKYLGDRDFRFAVITANAQKVLDNDVVLPWNNMAFTFLKTLLPEYPSLRPTALDIDSSGTAADIFAAFTHPSHIRFTASRRRQRYLRELRSTVSSTTALKNGGVYLITGGAKGIGLEISRYLAAEANAHLIMLGRGAAPANGPKHAVYYQVDVSDEIAMQGAFSEIKRRYGAIDGVIHCAGVPGALVSWKDLTLRELQSTITAKVHGTVLLEKHTRELHPDFFLLCSSLSTLVPQARTGDYVVANAFQDAFAAAMGKGFVAVNWPAWRETGMSHEYSKLRQAPVNEGPNLLSTEQGLKIFAMAINAEVSQLIVTDSDLQTFRINPFFRLESTGAPFQQTASETEKPAVKDVHAQLFEIWYEVLKMDHLTADDDFFDVGGHSLNAAQLLNRIRSIFKVDMEFDDLLDIATINSQATYLSGFSAKETGMLYEEIPAVPTQEYYELSNAQRRMWLAVQHKAAELAYLMFGAYRLSGKIDETNFRTAFERLFKRHESLRTIFVTVNGVPMQKILSPLQFDQAYSFRKLPAEAVEEHILLESRRGFDLEKGPLVRINLLHISEKEHVLLLNMHHIISDGWSMEIFVRDFCRLYNDPDDILPILPIHYKDFSAWHNTLLQSTSQAVHKDYWINKMQSLRSVEMPLDLNSTGVRSYKGDCLLMEVSTSSVSALRSLAESENVTMFVIMLSALSALFHRYTGQQEILISTPAAGRWHRDLEDQIGFYINSIFVRTPVDGQLTFRALLQQVSRDVAEALEHQHYPFDMLMDAPTCEPDVIGTIMDYGFTWNKESLSVSGPGLPFTITPVPVEEHTARARIWVFGTELAGRIFLKFEYDSGLFTSDTIRIFSERMLAILKNMGNNPGTTIEEVDLSLVAAPATTDVGAFFNAKF